MLCVLRFETLINDDMMILNNIERMLYYGSKLRINLYCFDGFLDIGSSLLLFRQHIGIRYSHKSVTVPKFKAPERHAQSIE